MPPGEKGNLKWESAEKYRLEKERDLRALGSLEQNFQRQQSNGYFTHSPADYHNQQLGEVGGISIE